jgi:ribonuclease R
MGRVAQVALRERLDAHRVVEDFMIAANVAAAKALESKTAPVVYRIHEPPNREKLIALKDYLATFERKLALGQVITPALFNRMLKSIEDDVEKALIMEAVLRSQTQAYYGPRNAGTSACRWGPMRISPRPSDAIRTCWSIARWSMRSIWNSRRPVAICPRCRGCMAGIVGSGADLRCDFHRRTPRDGGRARDGRSLCCGMALDPCGRCFRLPHHRGSALWPVRHDPGLGGDGLVPISVLGDERFHHDERAQVLRGESTGTTFAIGDRLRLRLAEANALTGALKFEPEDGQGRIERRGVPARQGGMKRRGSHLVGKRGRPANIRHQGKSGD